MIAHSPAMSWILWPLFWNQQQVLSVFQLISYQGCQERNPDPPDKPHLQSIGNRHALGDMTTMGVAWYWL